MNDPIIVVAVLANGIALLLGLYFLLFWPCNFDHLARRRPLTPVQTRRVTLVWWICITSFPLLLLSCGLWPEALGNAIGAGCLLIADRFSKN